MESPRRSLAASLSPLRLIDRRRSFNYNVEVLKTATVREVKMAVEAAFSHLPITVLGNVSWPHVWGQFCLSYDDQRLINEADYLVELGIRDGDQLRFICHISSYSILMMKHKSKTPPGVSSLKQLKLYETDVPYRFSVKTETWKKKRTQGQEDGVDSITQTQAQPSFLSTVSGGWLSYKSSPSQRGTKHRNATASTSDFRFKCYSEKDVWNMTKLISET
ncbi:hypothetical protein Bca52824_038502 [Brassica carinata]|uniref:SNRNP25 ubiquitin-like domain-containing protein n=1 Tax=Brassica carinata TaxID=52824 RepID=A0A8X7RM98_BRACI|nr:hypothetical protein Bca52824_038502 [Brassica carinata]